MSVSTWPHLFNKNNFILNSLVFSFIKLKSVYKTYFINVKTHLNSQHSYSLLFLQKNLIAEPNQFQIHINFHCKFAKF